MHILSSDWYKESTLQKSLSPTQLHVQLIGIAISWYGGTTEVVVAVTGVTLTEQKLHAMYM